LFQTLAAASVCLDSNLSEVYLTNDLGFPKEKLSIIKVVCTPFNIVCAMISGYLSASDPFRYQFYIQITLILLSSYSVLVLLGTFPDKEHQSTLTYVHVIVCMFLKDLVSNF
jgi:hypothetical protein